MLLIKKLLDNQLKIIKNKYNQLKMSTNQEKESKMLRLITNLQMKIIANQTLTKHKLNNKTIIIKIILMLGVIKMEQPVRTTEVVVKMVVPH